MGTSWISKKGGILERGGGGDLEKGGMSPLTNYDLNISEILQGVLHMNNILESLLKYHFHTFMTSLEI